MRLALSLAFLGLSSATELGSRQYGPYGHGPNSSSSSSSAPPSASDVSAASSTSGLTGDTNCVPLMCVSAVVNGSAVQYTLQSKATQKMGWMAVGFGSTMANTPMVIMWVNDDESITLSQRQARAEVMPTVVSNPPRVATVDATSSDVTAAQPRLAFTISDDGTKQQGLIWAFSTTNPDNKAVDATLVQHLDSGSFQLDLTKSLAEDDTSNPASGPNVSTGPTKIPFKTYQKYIIAHAVMSAIGFMIVLPVGAIYARLMRALKPSSEQSITLCNVHLFDIQWYYVHRFSVPWFKVLWFNVHWIAQWLVAGTLILVGFILGIVSVQKAGAPHLDDTHKRLGVILFLLYIIQCSLGGIIHFFKPRSSREQGKRPIQNYFHGFLGLSIIVLAFYQVRCGYREEWSKATGREDVPQSVNNAWIALVVILAFAYLVGLGFLRRQLKQEKDDAVVAQKNAAAESHHA